MAEGVVDSILRGWRDPRGAMARRLAGGPDEARALFDLFLACGLGFVASLPAAARRSVALGIEDPLAGAVAAHLFGFLFVAPLMLYGLAALVHLAARAAGGAGSFAAARAALFWGLLLGAPLALGVALAGALGQMATGAPPGPWIGWLALAAFGFWVWLLASNLAEAEGFPATGRVAAALGLACVGVAAGVAGLAGGAG